MDAAHLHLMVNHLPILGAPVVAGFLMWGIARGSRDVIRTALGAAAIVAALSYPVFLTGEPAEEKVEDRAWLRERLVHEHEARAEAGLIAILLTGALGGAVLWQSREGRAVPTASAGLTLAGLLVSSGLFGWSAVAGGLIRHDELRTDSSSATIPAENAAPVGGSAPARQGVKSDGDRDD